MSPENDDRQSSPLLLRRRLGSELRRLRDAAGISTEEVAAHLYCSISKISRIETARVAATPRDVRDMLDLYKVTGQQRDALMQLASEARQKEAWWHAHGDVPDVRTYVSFEESARSISAYSAALVPGLLQAEEYARAIIGVVYPQLRPHEVERHVMLRMARQSILTGKDSPTLQAVFDEEALHRLVGGRQAMRNQVHHLAVLR